VLPENVAVSNTTPDVDSRVHFVDVVVLFFVTTNQDSFDFASITNQAFLKSEVVVAHHCQCASVAVQ